jgi:Tfp pilus assembly protein PilX
MNMEIPNMLRSSTGSHRQHQRGVGALAVSLLLLFASSIIVFYLNRGLIFEQKTSANQVRSTSAFEMAEAGIEWATGMLNTASSITAACAPAGAGISFSATYAQRGLPADDSFVVTTNTFPGCKLNGTALTCDCPAPGVGATTADLGTAVQPSFTVAFAQAQVIDPVTGAVTTDPRALRLISTGCTAQAGACAPGATGAADANARVEVTLRFSPTLRAAPQAALTCGTNCAVGGSYEIRNTEVSSNGYLVNAGTTITGGPGTNYETIPGQPIQNAMIANDSSLSSLSSADPTCSNSAMF